MDKKETRALLENFPYADNYFESNIFAMINVQSFFFIDIILSGCDAVADIGFLLDASHNREEYYINEKNFLKTLAAYMGVSSNKTRIGVISFSFYAELNIKLIDHSNIISFNTAVDDIPLMNLSTRIDKALMLAGKDMFNIVNGARPGYPKLLILLISNPQMRSVAMERPSDVAEKIRKQGINILIIGIGSDVDPNELVEIGGGPENLYIAATNDVLSNNDFVEQIKEATCTLGVYPVHHIVCLYFII